MVWGDERPHMTVQPNGNLILCNQCHGNLQYQDKDIVCQDCSAVWHFCVGDNCPYEVSSK